MSNFFTYFMALIDSSRSTSSSNSNFGIFKLTDNSEYEWINDIIKFLNATIIPISVTLLIAAAFLIIILSALMVKAETSDEARKYRKRIIGIGVTVFIVLILLYFVGFFLPEIPTIIDGLKETMYKTGGTNTGTSS